MITAIGNVMRELHARNWITTRDGNASVRQGGSTRVYITPSGVRKTIIHPEHMIRMRIQEGELVVPKGTTPSGELHMHWLLLRDATKTRSVVHAHPTFTIAAMYRGFDLQVLCTQFPEIFRYTRVGPTVPNLPATSSALGDATAEQMGVMRDKHACKYDIVGQENHGVTAIGPDPWTAFEHIERLEHICKIVLMSGVHPDTVLERAGDV